MSLLEGRKAKALHTDGRTHAQFLTTLLNLSNRKFLGGLAHYIICLEAVYMKTQHNIADDFARSFTGLLPSSAATF